MLLPVGLRLAKEAERLVDGLAGFTTEQALRRAVRDLSRRIAEYLRAPEGRRSRSGSGSTIWWRAGGPCGQPSEPVVRNRLP